MPFGAELQTSPLTSNPMPTGITWLCYGWFSRQSYIYQKDV